MDPLIHINKVTGRNIESSIVGSILYGYSVPDLFQDLLRYAADYSGSVSVVDYLVDGPSRQTSFRDKPSMLDALDLFLSVLSNQRAPTNEDQNLGNWRPRLRKAASGTIFPGNTLVRTDYASFRTVDDADVNAVKIDYYVVEGKIFIPPIHLLRAMLSLSNVVNGKVLIWRHNFWGVTSLDGPGSGSPASNWLNGSTFDPYFQLAYKAMHWNGTTLRYELEVTAYITDQIHGADRYTYKGEIRFSPDLASVGGFYSEGWRQSGVYGAFEPSTGEVPPQFHAINLAYLERTDIPSVGTLRHVAGLPFSISDFAPGLFHTQSASYVKLLGDVSRNFESLVESPEFVPTLVETAKNIFGYYEGSVKKAKVFGSVLSEKTSLGRARLVLRFLSGTYLAYIFAISPGAKSALDVVESFSSKIRLVKGKSYVELTSPDGSLTGWPNGLKQLVLGYSDERVLGASCVYGSQAELHTDKASVLQALDRVLAELQKAGVEPDPSYLYAAIPFTFIFDALIFPVGTLLTDAYQRFKMIGQTRTTVGHSARLTVLYESGVAYTFYVRTNSSRQLIDPQRETWLVARGADAPMLLALFVVLFL